MLTIRIPRFRSEHFFSMFLVLFWGQDIIFSYIKGILLRIPYIKLTVDYYFPVLIVFCLAFSLPYILRSVLPKDIIFVLIVAMVYFSQVVLYPSNREYLLSVSVDVFTKILPLYFIGLCIDENKHFNILYIASVVNVFAFILYISVLSGEAHSDQLLYSGFMHRAYTLLPQLLVIIGYAIKKPNIFNITTGIVGSVVLVTCGNRGSVLLLFVFIVIGLFFLVERKVRKGVCAFMLIAGISVLLFYQWIIEQLSILISTLGMSPRFLNYIISGGFFESNGRNVITQKLLEMIGENPLVGYGLASDHIATGSYAHNFVIELWTSFGVVTGTLLFTVTAFVIIKAWTNNKNAIILCVLICVGFFKLFISSSFLFEGMFFVLLGYCVSLLRKDRQISNRKG